MKKGGKGVCTSQYSVVVLEHRKTKMLYTKQKFRKYCGCWWSGWFGVLYGGISCGIIYQIHGNDDGLIAGDDDCGKSVVLPLFFLVILVLH